MKILVIGGGGREHALAWKAAQNEQVETVYLAPGNAGSQKDDKLENVSIDVLDFPALTTFAKDKNIALTIVGPEVPLVEGIVDYFSRQGLACFGPSQNAAQLEGSKTFTKDFLARHDIPTAAYRSFTEVEPALAYLREQGAPIVVKADGLAAGKGVIVAETLDVAESAVKDMLADNTFGEAGCRVVVEEFLRGEEASFIVIADGTHVLPMATSQDHKRAGNGDTGLNTGGMGAYSPAPVITQAIYQHIMDSIIYPTIKGMKAEGNEYTGFLYAGLMITDDGTAKVIEYNCRFGDPETQPIMMRLQSDLVSLCTAAIDKSLNQCEPPLWTDEASVGVVLAAGGYPSHYETGLPIDGLDTIDNDACKVFHAGTKLSGNNIVTNGGRVLCITALGKTVTEAQTLAYDEANKISWQNVYKRTDIAFRAIEREKS